VRVLGVISRFIVVAGTVGCGRLAFEPRADGSSSPTRDASVDADPGFIPFEAESGTVVAPFRVDQDLANPSIFFIFDGNSRGLTGTGGVGFTVTIQRAGSYWLWARARPMDMADDSFFISIDGAPGQDFPTGECTFGVDWHWSAWRNTTFCPALGSKIGLGFTAGEHSIDFTSREGESMVDQFILTDDDAFVPN
jgi:hypothetical protein